MNGNTRMDWFALAIAFTLLAMPTLSSAQGDLDVTMRMVADDQELDNDFVQQLALPVSLDEPDPDTLEPGIEGIARDVQQDMLDLGSSLSEQSRESRDALGVELPGELELELGLEQGLDLEPDLEPDLELEPELDLPAVEEPDLSLSTPELE
jgi:hypothetical protein